MRVFSNKKSTVTIKQPCMPPNASRKLFFPGNLFFRPKSVLGAIYYNSLLKCHVRLLLRVLIRSPLFVIFVGSKQEFTSTTTNSFLISQAQLLN